MGVSTKKRYLSLNTHNTPSHSILTFLNYMAGRAAGMCVAALVGGGTFAFATKAVIGVPPPPPPPAPPSVAVELLKKEADTVAALCETSLN